VRDDTACVQHEPTRLVIRITKQERVCATYAPVRWMGRRNAVVSAARDVRGAQIMRVPVWDDPGPSREQLMASPVSTFVFGAAPVGSRASAGPSRRRGSVGIDGAIRPFGQRAGGRCERPVFGCKLGCKRSPRAKSLEPPCQPGLRIRSRAFCSPRRDVCRPPAFANGAEPALF